MSTSKRDTIVKRRDALIVEIARLRQFGHGLGCGSGASSNCNLCQADHGLQQLNAEMESDAFQQP
jgi:hypothetical protein